jgi:hypothetical protein
MRWDFKWESGYQENFKPVCMNIINGTGTKINPAEFRLFKPYGPLNGKV